jgi:serine/threonine-protein kinase ULK/ATG1
MMNMSKFYIKNNKVVSHPSEISVKEDINNFAVDIARGNSKNNATKYDGPILKRQTQRQAEEEKGDDNFDTIPNPYENEKEDEISMKKKPSATEGELAKEETQREKLIRITKNNSNRLLHERNKYVFLASVAEDTISNNVKLSGLVAFLLVKRLFFLLTNMKMSLLAKTNIFGLREWDYYVKTKEFDDICVYISREYDVFKVYFESIYDKITKDIKTGSIKSVPQEVLNVLNMDLMQSFEKAYDHLLLQYSREMIDECTANGEYYEEDELRQKWQHVDQIIDCLRLESVFRYDPEEKNAFNFKKFYEETAHLSTPELQKRVKTKFASM